MVSPRDPPFRQFSSSGRSERENSAGNPARDLTDRLPRLGPLEPLRAFATPSVQRRDVSQPRTAARPHPALNRSLRRAPRCEAAVIRVGLRLLRERTGGAASPATGGRKYKDHPPRARCRPLRHPNRHGRTPRQQPDRENAQNPRIARRSISRGQARRTATRSDEFPSEEPESDQPGENSATRKSRIKAAQQNGPRTSINATARILMTAMTGWRSKSRDGARPLQDAAPTRRRNLGTAWSSVSSVAER